MTAGLTQAFNSPDTSPLIVPVKETPEKDKVTVWLTPFTPGEAPDILCRTTIQTAGSRLHLKYHLEGVDLKTVRLPRPENLSTRQDFLWKHTCFEAFWTWEGTPGYWELNLSPSGAWNLYHFEGYRAGQKREERVSEVKILPKPEDPQNLYSLQTELDLSPLLPSNFKAELHLGLSAIIETQDLAHSFWALSHQGKKPDFHLRESFTCKKYLVTR
jgi:hypothetical protein